jgi:hypothetical protein
LLFTITYTLTSDNSASPGVRSCDLSASLNANTQMDAVSAVCAWTVCVVGINVVNSTAINKHSVAVQSSRKVGFILSSGSYAMKLGIP